MLPLLLENIESEHYWGETENGEELSGEIWHENLPLAAWPASSNLSLLVEEGFLERRVGSRDLRFKYTVQERMRGTTSFTEIVARTPSSHLISLQIAIPNEQSS